MNKNFYGIGKKSAAAFDQKRAFCRQDLPQYDSRTDAYARPYSAYESPFAEDPYIEYGAAPSPDIYSEEISRREKELLAREMRFLAKQLLVQNRLPAELADIIRTDSEKTVMTAVQMLVRFRDGADSRSPLDKLRVLDEKKLPEAETDPGQVNDLRRAFGLI